MTLNPEIKRLASELAEFRKSQKEITRTRLDHAYRFITDLLRKEKGGAFEAIIDFGTYDGSFLHHLLGLGKRVISFDLDTKKLNQARERNELKEALGNGRLQLLAMTAQNRAIETQVDLIFAFEIFGAGFEGTVEDILTVFNNINHLLKGGGYCAFTVRSRTFDELFASTMPVDSFDLKEEVTVYRRYVTPIIQGLEGRVDWYGQIIYQLEQGKPPIPPFSIWRDEEFTGHIQWNEDAFTPRKIPDLTRESPVYWIGVWQKP